MADDVCFSHIMGSVRGKEAFYGIYRLAATAWRYKVCLPVVVCLLGLGFRVSGLTIHP